jgi:Ca-activated chloride channel family protein
MKTKLALLFVLFVALAAIPTPARADGIIIPDPPICIEGDCPPPPCFDTFPCPPRPRIVQLAIRNHYVDVTLQDQLAVTHVDQVFYNPNEYQVEGTYIFPIPVDAAVSSFTLWIDGKPVEGQVLDAEQARQTYEEIVRSMNDPALLEYVGRGAVQARIFPIPPKGERRIELEYVQALTAENGLVRYTYPLSTEKFSLWPLEEVRISLDVRTSASPIRAAYSPSHDVAVSRQDERHLIAGYEASNVLPDSDFTFFYSLGEEEAFHLFSYRDPDDPVDADGFFLLLLAPRPDAAARTLPKDVLVVLDRSGSMEGEKFVQAQEALRFVLRHLNPEDRFNIIVFSTGLETYARALRPAEEANEAIAWVDQQSAQGSTDINRALLEAAAIADSERPTYLIFLTDGLPTEGVVESQEILDNFEDVARDNLRLFSFGVGYDVDTFLLDSLAQAHHGTSSYVLPGERLDEAVSSFYAKISTPVLTDLSLDFGEMRVHGVYPDPLPDLFSGTQVVVVGRYRRGGETTVTLRGTLDGQTQTFRFPDQRFASDNDSLLSTLDSPLPRLWATRKIGYLLNQVRLQGADEETIDQIVRLSIRYGIVTPYTSYLVTEEMPLGAAEQERIARDEYNQLLEAPAAPLSGQEAVEKASGMGGMADAQSAAPTLEEAAETVRVVGSRVFVSAGGAWIDTAFDPEQMKTVKVAFLSDDYFALAASRPELAAAFGLGERVIALADGVAYEVVEAGAAVEEVDIPEALTTLETPDEPIQIPENPAPTQEASQPPTAPGTMPCASGLLPLAVLPLAGLIWITRKR